MEREADRVWYTQDEGHLYEDFEDTYFVGDKNQFDAVENELERLKLKKKG